MILLSVIEHSSASYSFNMLRGLMSREKLEEHTPTIFIKLNKDTKMPEKAWD
jgi:hypothetical protein